MTQEDKELLLKDLCARLGYGVICQMEDKFIINDSPFYDYTLLERHVDLFRNHKDFYIKPYLRPMSSMTEEEKEELRQEQIKDEQLFADFIKNHPEMRGLIIPHLAVDWCDKNMFDYRRLIPKGLAIEVTKENNPYKE